MRQRVLDLAAFSRAGWAACATTALVVAVVAVVPLTNLVPTSAGNALSDLGQLVVAAAAASTTAWRARSSSGRLRGSWAAISAGCAAWAVGEAVWSWYDLVPGTGAPFPSAADGGFLLFPVGAVLGLALYPRPATSGDQRRSVLDSLIVGVSLSLVSWTTVLSTVATGQADNQFAFLVSLSYPATDLIVLTMLVIVMSRHATARNALGLLGLGVAAITVADSAFAAFTATNAALDETIANIAWVVGFGALTVAPLRRPSTAGVANATRASAGTSKLPYLPVVVAISLLCAEVMRGQLPDLLETTLGCITVGLVLMRQHSVVRENAKLVLALRTREGQLRHQAFHDALTGLANRALFQDRVAHALDLHRRDLRSLAVLFCDLDDFKLVNDTLGHHAGDELLVRVAERLRGALRAGDTLARLGGDEFAVLIEDGGDPWAVAAQVIEIMHSPYTVDGRRLEVRGSVGLTVVEGDMLTPSPDVLLAQADTAMYAAKRAGKGCFRAFEPGMELEEVADDGLRRRLTAAIQQGAISLRYQPIAELDTGRVTGFEALARWQEAGTGIPPDVFIPAAERMGLIAELTALVLDQACAQLAAWDRAGARTDITVAVNVSPQVIVDRGFPERVLAVLARHRVAPDRLVVEITESGLLSDFRAAKEVTSRLNAAGIKLSLDDFGVGYSSLTHLSQIPLQSLKIDRLFIAGLGRDEGQTRFTEALLRFAADLGLEVIAEGIERLEQLVLLRELGCAGGQGFLLGRAAEADSWTPQLRREQRSRGVPGQRATVENDTPAAPERLA